MKGANNEGSLKTKVFNDGISNALIGVYKVRTAAAFNWQNPGPWPNL